MSLDFAGQNLGGNPSPGRAWRASFRGADFFRASLARGAFPGATLTGVRREGTQQRDVARC